MCMILKDYSELHQWKYRKIPGLFKITAHYSRLLLRFLQKDFYIFVFRFQTIFWIWGKFWTQDFVEISPDIPRLLQIMKVYKGAYTVLYLQFWTSFQLKPKRFSICIITFFNKTTIKYNIYLKTNSGNLGPGVIDWCEEF